jgi:predicted nucleic acid-binding protein
MLTTWPAFTEAMYLLGGGGGWVAQDALWCLVERGDLEIVMPESGQDLRMRALMERYRDRPMNLADASLAALAEERALRDIFTLDQADFQIYRLYPRQIFRLCPRRL